MLYHPTLEKLTQLRLTGMHKALLEQNELAEINTLSFEERLGLLVDREITERENRGLALRLREAKLRHSAVLEDIDYRQPRGLDKTVMVSLAGCQWVANHLNLLITGPTGVGKSWIACALTHKACRDGYRAHYLRMPRLFQELALAKADGRYPKLLATLSRTDVIILDDWGLVPFTDDQRRDMLEILEDRHGRRSTIVTSQIPTERWHETINDPTLADAILDRLVHNAYKINLKGESMRKRKSKLTSIQESE